MNAIVGRGKFAPCGIDVQFGFSLKPVSQLLARRSNGHIGQSSGGGITPDYEWPAWPRILPQTERCVSRPRKNGEKLLSFPRRMG